MDVIGDMVNQVTHLSDIGAAITICGAAIGSTWGLRKVFYWAGQIGCKDCRKELAKRTDKHGNAR